MVKVGHKEWVIVDTSAPGSLGAIETGKSSWRTANTNLLKINTTPKRIDEYYLSGAELTCTGMNGQIE
jgi:hypothetical protein